MKPNQSFPMSNETVKMNGTFTGGECFEDNSEEVEKNIKIISFSLNLVISLVGNILVILVVYKNKNMRKTINFFIVNMAASDLIIPLLVMPMQIARTCLQGSWITGGKVGLVLCKFVYFFSEIPGPVSVLSLICMAIDRFVGVVFPLKASLISSRVRISMIAVTWVISLGFTTTNFYTMKLLMYGGNLYCVMRWHDNLSTHTTIQRAYFTAASLVFFIVPFVLLVLLYSIILITLGKRKFPRLNQSKEAKQRNRRVSRSATVIAFTIVLVFWLCWCPYNTILFLWAFKWDWNYPKFCGFKTIVSICLFLTWASAAVNPCIYFVLIENYRKGLRKVLPRTMSTSLNSSLRQGRSVARPETHIHDDTATADCLELVDQSKVFHFSAHSNSLTVESKLATQRFYTSVQPVVKDGQTRTCIYGEL